MERKIESTRLGGYRKHPVDYIKEAVGERMRGFGIPYVFIEDILKNVDFSSYRNSRGTAITTAISVKLRKLYPQISDKVVSMICGTVKDMYVPEVDNATVYFGYKRLLGAGTYESEPTCLDTFNKSSRELLCANKRAQVLVINGKGDSVGRCIVWFCGRRRVYLTNFYTYHLPESKLMFVDALGKLFGVKFTVKVKYNNDVGYLLPIYENLGGMIVWAEKDGLQYEHPTPRDWYVRCQVCGKRVRGDKFYVYVDCNTVMQGCSEECARVERVKCGCCGDYVHEDDVYDTEDGVVCEACYESYYVYCDGCGRVYHSDNATYHNDRHYCSECFDRNFVTCKGCGMAVFFRDAVDCDDGMWCIDCNTKRLEAVNEKS